MFSRMWKAIDGKKTASGIILSGIGLLMYFNPVTAVYATEVLTTGVSVLSGGLIHKQIKKNISQVSFLLILSLYQQIHFLLI